MKIILCALALISTASAADRTVRISVDPASRKQVIAGFGVNFDGSYFRDAQKPMIDMLIDDLGATLFRFDPYALTNWESRNDNDDPKVMNPPYYNDRFSNPMFEAAWAAVRIGLTVPESESAKMAMVAFHNPDGSTVIVGVKEGGPNSLEIAGVGGKWDAYQTTRDLDCVRTDVAGSSPIALAEESVFTVISK